MEQSITELFREQYVLSRNQWRLEMGLGPLAGGDLFWIKDGKAVRDTGRIPTVKCPNCHAPKKQDAECIYCEMG